MECSPLLQFEVRLRGRNVAASEAIRREIRRFHGANARWREGCIRRLTILNALVQRSAHMTKTRTITGYAALVVNLGACGGGLSPISPTPVRPVADAVDGARMTSSEPLVVGFRAEDRVNLEVAMRQGIAIVAMRGGAIELLRNCHGAGDYGYVSVVPKEHAVRIADEQELRINVPNLVPALGASLKADLERGATVDVAMVITGMMRTTRAEVAVKELAGACEGATHYVRGATVGAFSLATQARAKAGGEARILGAGAGGATSTERSERAREGDLDLCRSSSADSPGTDSRCKALLRLELAPVGSAASDVARAVSCPGGLVYLDGKCTRFPAPEDLPCMKGNVQACTAHCDKFDASACGVLAQMHVDGDGVARNEGKAQTLAERGCRAKGAEACAVLAHLTQTRSPPVAASAALDACKLGIMSACTIAGRAFENGEGVTKAVGIAIASYQRGCDGGFALACWELGRFREKKVGPAHYEPSTLPIDATIVRHALDRGCGGGVAPACRELSSRMTEKPLREQWARRGCDLGDGLSCLLAEKELARGSSERLKFLSRACELGPVEPSEYNRGNTASIGCTNAGVIYSGRGDKSTALHYFSRGCKEGSSASCFNASTETEGDQKRDFQERACDLGDDHACLSLVRAVFLMNDRPVTPAGGAKEGKRVFGFIEHACERDNGAACFMLGSLLAGDFDFLGTPSKKTVGLPIDAPRSRTFFRSTCTAAAQNSTYDEWCRRAKKREGL